MDAFASVAQGRLRGTREGAVERFLGVPYAAPPFGPRRMMPPEPVEPWEGVREATAFGATVPKGPYPHPYDELLPEPDIPGQDCLNLNVWTPGASGIAHPVFVWIHGGAFANGSGAVSHYDGTAFARDGVVCVTINYRLGADGFIDVDDRITNVGILDQLAALTWIQHNIGALGGDPTRVTIGGESAGAMSVGTLLASPRSTGLFRGAILQSGAAHHAISRSSAQVVAAALAGHLGTVVSRAAFAEVPVAELLTAQAEVAAEVIGLPDPSRWGEVAANLMPFEPVIDGSIVPELPIRSIEAGAGQAVPVLVGTNSDEQLLFMAPNGLVDIIDDGLLELAVGSWGFPDPKAVIDLYRDARPGDSPGLLLAAMATDWFFRIPAVRLAEARDGAPTGTWMYEFAWPSTVRGGILGACHALEIPFAFDNLVSDQTDHLIGPGAPQGLADTMHAAWVRFITDGDPGWPAYDADHRPVMRFDTSSAVVSDPRPEERSVWAGVR